MAVPAIHSEMLHVSCAGIHDRIMDSGENFAQGGARSERRFVWYSTEQYAKVKASQEDGEMEKEVEKKITYL